MKLYEDRLELRSLFGGLEKELYFSEIRQIGFLNALNSATNKYINAPLSTSEDDDMIIIMATGRRQVFDGSDFNYLPLVYSFIAQRIQV